MPREYSRTQRVADYLQRELAVLLQQEMRDPRLGMVSITGVEVSGQIVNVFDCSVVPGAGANTTAANAQDGGHAIVLSGNAT